MRRFTNDNAGGKALAAFIGKNEVRVVFDPPALSSRLRTRVPSKASKERSRGLRELCEVKRWPGQAWPSPAITSVPANRNTLLFADEHALDVHELADAEMRAFAAIARMLYAAKGHPRIGAHIVVHEAHASFEHLRRYSLAPANV